MHKYEALIRRYFDAATRPTTGRWCLASRPMRALVGADSNEAVIEWTQWKRTFNAAQRGDEWYVFDEASGLIREIRAYYAAPAVKDTAALPQVRGTYMGELVEFDYAGRGYHLDAP